MCIKCKQLLKSVTLERHALSVAGCYKYGRLPSSCVCGGLTLLCALIATPSWQWLRLSVCGGFTLLSTPTATPAWQLFCLSE